MLLFLAVQRQRCIKFRVLRGQDFYTMLALQSHPPDTGVLKWEILVSALGSAPEGAPGNRGALGGAPESAQADWGCSRECSRECSSC